MMGVKDNSRAQIAAASRRSKAILRSSDARFDGGGIRSAVPGVARHEGQANGDARIVQKRTSVKIIPGDWPDALQARQESLKTFAQGRRRRRPKGDMPPQKWSWRNAERDR